MDHGRVPTSAKQALCLSIIFTSFLLTVSAQEQAVRRSLTSAIGQRLELGIGDRRGSMLNGRRITWYRQAAEDGLIFKYFEMWLTQNWREQWVGKQAGLRQMASDGYTLVLVYYYFGDSINKESVEAGLFAWYADCERLHRLIDIDRDVMVVIEPEFNKRANYGTSINNWSGWNSAVIGAIERIRGTNPHIKVGLCPGDFGEFNLQTSMSESARYSDFVAFQELRGSTHPSSRSRSYRDVTASALRYSDYLHRTFRLPVMLAYFGVSSYDDSSGNDWSQLQSNILSDVLSHIDDLENRGVFSVIYMAYYDDPQHDYSFFGEAERHFGLRDSSGAPKPAWYVWQAAANQIAKASNAAQPYVR
ncbi:MAG TPA: hypothetical protein VFC63_00185 [Blastocatellia bacterium]|nr:hypothetical protein [Blastocatellia bacterium]